MANGDKRTNWMSENSAVKIVLSLLLLLAQFETKSDAPGKALGSRESMRNEEEIFELLLLILDQICDKKSWPFAVMGEDDAS